MEDISRRLFDAGGSRLETTAPPTRSTTAGGARLGAPLSEPQLDADKMDAEQALRSLEAEWAIRMEAPLSALACLDERVTCAIDKAEAVLPRTESTQAST